MQNISSTVFLVSVLKIMNWLSNLSVSAIWIRKMLNHIVLIARKIEAQVY